MKATAAALALLTGAFSLAPLLTRPAPPSASRAGRTHDCCCVSCPGPGLCPCESGSAGGSACVKGSDDLPSNIETPPAPSPLKLACELPHLPRALERRERRADSEQSPHVPVLGHSLEKVPISVA